MNQNMTTGNIATGLIKFSVPLVLSGILQQLYNWTDAFILGNIEGEHALAAVGATTTISEFLILMITGFSVGLSIMAAQLFGSGRRQELMSLVHLFSTIMGIIFLVVCTVCSIWAGTLLGMIQTPKDIYTDAQRYLQIVFLGIPFIAVYNVYAAALRGIGDSRTPFIMVVASSFCNILLDICFVGKCRYGVTGAAAATIFSQIFMTVFTILYAAKKHEDFRVRRNRGMPCGNVLSQGIVLGIPTALQASVGACGNLILQNFMNGFGTHTVAAITTAYRIDSIIMLPIINLGSGISTMVAQNVGAKEYKRAQKGFAIGSIMMIVVTICLILFINIAGGFLVSIFGLSGEAEQIGIRFLKTISRFFVVYGMAVAMKSFLEGNRNVVFSGIASMFVLGLRIFLSYTFKENYGNDIIAYAEGVSWIALFLICLIRCCVFFKQKEKFHKRRKYKKFTKLLQKHDGL